MMVKKMILFICLNICKLPLAFLSIKQNRISFISLESDCLENDFKLLHDVLINDPSLDVKCSLIKFKKSFRGYFLYFIHCIKQFFIINTSKVVILDYNNYVVSSCKRKGVAVIQLWHASGAIKKFGNEIKRDYKISGYDYVICNADAFIPYYIKAFSVSEKQVITTGIPRTDILSDKKAIIKDRSSMEKRFPQIIDKKVILYAPTFRGRITTGFHEENIYLDLEKIMHMLPEDYVLCYKLHPLVAHTMDIKNRRVICCNNENLYQLFSITDILISDYSALIFDFAIFEKPIISYVPDIDRYENETGLFLDYEKEMPGPICKSEEEVVEVINAHDFHIQEVQDFKKKYVKFTDGKSKDRVIDLIYKVLSE